MKPSSFAYHRAGSLEEAVALLAEAGEDAKLLAGGQSLVPMMNLRLARPTVLIDINDVPGLAYVLAAGGGLRVGALTRHAQLEHHPGRLSGLELLPAAARLIGHYPIRARGTVGGSLAHADAVAEWCLLALLFGATLRARGPVRTRTIAADDFFEGLFTTALAPDEMLCEVVFGRGYQAADLQEFAPRHGDFAIVAAAVGFDLDAGRLVRPRVVLGGVAGTPLVLSEVGDLLEGERPSAELFAEAAWHVGRIVDPPPDAQGSSEYRAALAGVLVERALAAALERHREARPCP